MVINFLQRKKLLPCLQQYWVPDVAQSAGLNKVMVEKRNVAFDKTNLELKSIKAAEVTGSLGQLFIEMLDYYGHRFDFKRNVMSPRMGTVIPKEHKDWRYIVAMEDPIVSVSSTPPLTCRTFQ